jgi:hypothetical protein
MTRRRNLLIWIGFLLVLAAPVTYLLVFVRYPATRDVPWPTLLLFGAGLLLVAFGLRRAFREPEVWRGRIAGSIVFVLSVLLLGFFAFNIFYVARQLPPSERAPRVGETAPDFALRNEDGIPVTLAQLLDSRNAVVLIFYRGFW